MKPRSFAFFAVLVSLGLGCACLRPAHADTQTVHSSFQNGGKAVGLEIWKTRLGIQGSRGVTRSEAIAFGDSIGSPLDSLFPEGFIVYKLSTPKMPAAIFQQARDVARAHPEFVLRAGLVVYQHVPSQPAIVTDEFIVRFVAPATPAEIDAINAQHNAEIVRRPGPGDVPNEYLMRVTATNPVDGLEMSKRYAALHEVKYSVPNFVHVIVSDGSPWEEPYYAHQWHLDNPGGQSGEEDADIDARKAWDLSQGDGVVVAVIDGGFDVEHEDLKNNLWENPGERSLPCDKVDNDGNGYVDDLHGWNFLRCVLGCGSCGTLLHEPCNDPCPGPPRPPSVLCGDLHMDSSCLLAIDFHGTAIAGLIAAQGDNGKGLTGVAPKAKLMLIRRDLTTDNLARDFRYAWSNGAHVINCSWHLNEGDDLPVTLEGAIKDAAQLGRAGKGCVVVFSMSDAAGRDCSNGTDPSRLWDLQRSDGQGDAVIAVSASTNLDRKATDTGYGDCLDVLAPAHGGTLHVATTDHSGTRGYNVSDADLLRRCPNGESTDDKYTFCFTGTSASAAIVSGVAALIVSADPDLTQPQVKRLLQDTCDKIEDRITNATDTGGHYDDATGLSHGASGINDHGYGRVNAFEAIRVVAPEADHGNSGVDIFVRDNGLDWGNTEQPSSRLFGSDVSFMGYWASGDIKVDAPPLQPAPTTNAAFEALTDEDPVAGLQNRVYVRIRNRGPLPAENVVTRLYWAPYGTALPVLPSDFWSSFPNKPTVATDWTMAAPSEVIPRIDYSGTSGSADNARIASFVFDAPQAGPERHYCFLFVADTPNDRPTPLRGSPKPEDFDADNLTQTENNVGQRNVQLVPETMSMVSAYTFNVRNITARPMRVALNSDRPRGWRVDFLDQTGHPLPHGFPVDPGKSVPVTMKVDRRLGPRTGTIEVYQQTRPNETSPETVMGGLTIRFRSTAKRGPR